MGLDVSLRGIPTVEEPPEGEGYNETAWEAWHDKRPKSCLHPEHLWTPVYLRSSYNETGFNSVARLLTELDLYSVFEPGDRYEFKPDWDKALEVARRMQRALQEAENLAVTTVYYNSSAQNLKSPRDAIKCYGQVMAESQNFVKEGAAWSSAKGLFIPKGIKIKAVISGISEFTERPCVYVVRELEDKLWYEQACEILVEELIPLGIANRETAYLIWSG